MQFELTQTDSLVELATAASMARLDGSARIVIDTSAVSLVDAQVRA